MSRIKQRKGFSVAEFMIVFSLPASILVAIASAVYYHVVEEPRAYESAKQVSAGITAVAEVAKESPATVVKAHADSLKTLLNVPGNVVVSPNDAHNPTSVRVEIGDQTCEVVLEADAASVGPKNVACRQR